MVAPGRDHFPQTFTAEVPVPFLFVPEQIRIIISVDSGLLSLLRLIVDQQSDRAAMVALSAEVRAQAIALKAVLPPKP